MVPLGEMITAGFDGDLRKEVSHVAEFKAGFNELVHGLSKAYRLNEEVFGQEASIKRLEEKELKESGSINRADVFLANVEFDPNKMDISQVGLGATGLKEEKVLKARVDSSAFSREGVVAVLAHRAARLEMLAAGGERGIPETYATAFDQARKGLDLAKDAAVLADNWNYSWGSLSPDNALRRAAGRVAKGNVKKAVLVAALGLAGCMVPVDKDGHLTNIPEVATEPVATQVSAEASGAETPVPNNEFLSQIRAGVEFMSPERMVELQKQYASGTVYGYELGGDGKNKVKTLAVAEKEGVEVVTGYTLLSQDGGKSEILVIRKDGQNIFVRNDGTFMTNLIELNVDGYTVLGEFGSYENNQDSTKKTLVYPSDEPLLGQGIFLSWQAIDKKTGQMWMFSIVDHLLHEVDKAATLFKNAMPIESNTMFLQADALVDENGKYEFDRTDTGQAQIIFEDGTVYEWKNGVLVEVEQVSYEAPEGGWNSVIAEGVAMYPENKPWVDGEGNQHFKFQGGEFYGNDVANMTPEQVAKVTKDLESYCPPVGCLSKGTGGSFWVSGEMTGEMEIVVYQNGDVELQTGHLVLNNLKGKQLQVIKAAYLLPPYDEGSKFYYKGLDLGSNSKFNLGTILRVFGGGTMRTKIFTMFYAGDSNPPWQMYGERRLSKEYMKMFRSWVNRDCDPAEDFMLIGF